MPYQIVHENGSQTRFNIYVHATPLTDFTLLINWPGIIADFFFKILVDHFISGKLYTGIISFRQRKQIWVCG